MLFVPIEDPSIARGRFLYLLFMFVLFLMLSPNPPNPYRLLALESLASREKHSFEALKNATFEGPFQIPMSLNVTGVQSPFSVLTRICSDYWQGKHDNSDPHSTECKFNIFDADTRGRKGTARLLQ